MRNERLTALVGAVLLILMMAEISISINLYALIPAHLFLGVLFTFPLLVKIGSTGYRFLRYYTGSPAFVQKGPSRLRMRLLAPFLLVVTLSLITKGITPTLLGPTKALSVWMLRLHAPSVVCWLPLVALHVGAYLRQIPRLTMADWRKRSSHLVLGRGWRYGITIVAVLAGTSAAALFLPDTASWVAWEAHSSRHIPGPLIVALFTTVLAGLWNSPVFVKSENQETPHSKSWFSEALSLLG